MMTTHIHLVARLRGEKPYLYFSYMPSWCGQAQLYLVSFTPDIQVCLTSNTQINHNTASNWLSPFIVTTVYSKMLHRKNHTNQENYSNKLGLPLLE
jgi:hypothetical protein